MSVLIKGMKMPKEGCKDCLLVKRGNVFDICPFLERAVNGNIERGGKPYGCPLIELPDHGDLIDREYAIASACSGRIRALPTTEDGENWIRVKEVRQSLKSVPAVIPTERSKE